MVHSHADIRNQKLENFGWVSRAEQALSPVFSNDSATEMGKINEAKMEL
jgi:hypothetical protein